MATTVQSPSLAADDLDAAAGPAPARRVTFVRLAFVAGGLIVAGGLVLRFWTTSDLWLDEALTVNIARLPVHQIPGALRHDGAPPLYYLLLHFWMLVFGQGDVAVRALSGLIAVFALPLGWVAGRRLGGRAGAWATVLLMATSPFAITYATSARMYSLMVLLSLLGLFALVGALEDPSTWRLALLGLMTALLIYTHYWSLYLIAVTGCWLLFRVRRAVVTASHTAAQERRSSLRCFVAMVIGGLTFLPWLPIFVFQTFHTGTPWANPAGPGDILGVLGEYSGSGATGAALGLALFILVLLGLFGRPIDDRRILLELHTRRRARPIAWMFIGTLGLAVLAGAAAGAAFVGRYTAVVFPLFMLLAGLGATAFLDRKIMAGVLAVTSTFGLIVAVGANSSNRTEAGRVATVINQSARAGDVVVYCPDQLGPAVDRLLHVPVQELTFPRAIGPQRVDWVNYRQVISGTSVDQFGQRMLTLAGTHAIWYVWSGTYPGTDHKCNQLGSLFESLRPVNQQLVAVDTSDYEHEALTRFAP